MPKTKLTKAEEIRILEHGIHVTEGIFAQFSSIYDQLRIKVLSMIAAQLVIVGFIFNDWELSKVNFSVGEWIVFGIATSLQVIPLGLMMWILSPISWLIPGNVELYENPKNKYDDYHEYLQEHHKDYSECISGISQPVNKRSKAFSYVLYALSLSVIILLVLKNGG